MKMPIISTHETSSIIRQLNERGTWRAERSGATIVIALLKTPAGEAVQYSVTIAREQPTTLHADTVPDAVEDINDMLAAWRQKPAPTDRVTDPARTGMGHVVRRRGRDSHAANDGGLFG
jgi:hypothetical protein